MDRCNLFRQAVWHNRDMTILELLGTAALSEFMKRTAAFALDKVSKLPSFRGKDANGELDDFVKLNLPLPPGLSKAERKAAILEATTLVTPTFEQIMKFSPTVRAIEKKEGLLYRRSGGAIKKAVKKAVRKAPAKKAVKKAPAKKAVKKAVKKAPTKR
jgi:hypothetical protein